MKKVKDNPGSNKLQAGVTEEKINAAVVKSGYPLQTRVSKQLSDKFFVQEEWSFADKKTGEIRSTDILAEKWFWEKEKKQPRVRPNLNLIIECKQSELPYIFFLSDHTLWAPNFPFIAGLSNDDLTLTTDNDPSTWMYSVADALSMSNDDFLIKNPLFCNKFSKCERKGADILLSGEMPFNEIVYPLLSAMNHFKIAEKPPTTAYYFDLHLVLGIGVLDAPMVGVKVGNKKHELISLPWVRVVKHQTDKNPDFTHRNNLFAIDIVHKDFLEEYIDKHVLPFAERFSKLIIKHQEVIANGKGFVSNIGNVKRSEIEKSLIPTSFRNQQNRYKVMVKNVTKLITGQAWL